MINPKDGMELSFMIHDEDMMAEPSGSDDWTSGSLPDLLAPDDLSSVEHLQAKLPQFIEMLTRLGGEVCRLRAETDGLVEQGHELRLKLDKLRSVIEERGILDLEEFDLACDMAGLSDAPTGPSKPRTPH
jgi:hypothetical protein